MLPKSTSRPPRYHTARPPNGKQQAHRGRKGDSGVVDRQPRVAEAAAGSGETANFPVLLHEGLDDPDPREHSHQGGSLFADRCPIVLMPRLQIAREVPASGQDQRHRQQGDQGQLGVEAEAA